MIALHPPDASPALVAGLRDAGVELMSISDGAALAEAEPAGGWSLVVVELSEDPAAGLSLARRAREASAAPVLIAAPRRHAGILATTECHDFVLAPYDAAEVAARARRLLGERTAAGESISFKDLTLNLATYQATVGTAPIDLTYMEYELLRFFATNPGRVWSREQLLSRVWGYDYFGGARTVDVHVRRLRAKLGEERSSWIATVRSVGYRFG